MNALFCIFLIIVSIIWVVAVEYNLSEWWDIRDNEKITKNNIAVLQKRDSSEIYKQATRSTRPDGVDSLANPQNLGTPTITVGQQLSTEMARQQTIQKSVIKRCIYFVILAIILALVIWGFCRVSWGFQYGEPFYLYKKLHDVLTIPIGGK